MKLLLAFVTGLVVGIAAPALAKMEDGYLLGWEVKIGKNVVCKDPWIWSQLREIECK